MPIENLYEAIKVSAMKNVLSPDHDGELRQVLRWYSKTFHTPLHDVYDLPVDYLLQHYYEETFSELEDPVQKERLQELAMTAEELRARKMEEVDSDEAFIREAEEEAAKQAQKLEEIKAPAQKDLGLANLTPKELPVKDEEEPLIKVVFDATIFEDELDSDSLP